MIPILYANSHLSLHITTILRPPNREGAANEELIDFMSHVLGVRSRCISLEVGSKSRNKMLIVNTDKTTEDVYALLRESISNK